MRKEKIFKLVSLIVILMLTACGGKSYHEFALTNSFQTSKQRPHLEALKSYQAGGIHRKAKACIYYPKELGGFSSGCGEINFNPYQFAKDNVIF